MTNFFIIFIHKFFKTQTDTSSYTYKYLTFMSVESHWDMKRWPSTEEQFCNSPHEWMKPRRGSKIRKSAFRSCFLIRNDCERWCVGMIWWVYAYISNRFRKTPLAPDLAPSENLAVKCLYNKSLRFFMIVFLVVKILRRI